MKRLFRSFGLLVWALVAVAGPVFGGAEDGAGPIDLDALGVAGDATVSPARAPNAAAPAAQPALDLDAAAATPAQPAVDLDAAATTPAQPAGSPKAAATSAQPAVDLNAAATTPAQPAIDQGAAAAAATQPVVDLDEIKTEPPATVVEAAAVPGTPEDAARFKQEGMDLQAKGDVVAALKAYRRSVKIQADAQIEGRVKKLEAYLKAKGLEVPPDS